MKYLFLMVFALICCIAGIFVVSAMVSSSTSTLKDHSAKAVANAKTTTSQNSKSSVQITSKEHHEMCKKVSNLAHKVMTYRQSGAELQPIKTQIIESTSDKNLVAVRISLRLIQKAYQQPIFEDDSKKNQIIQKFSNDALTTCLTNPKVLIGQ